MCTCEVCGEEYEEGSMHYDDTCDNCARDNGILD
jgi:hypothetical protein